MLVSQADRFAPLLAVLPCAADPQREATSKHRPGPSQVETGQTGRWVADDSSSVMESDRKALQTCRGL